MNHLIENLLKKKPSPISDCLQKALDLIDPGILEMEEKLSSDKEALTIDHKKYEIINKSMHDGIIPKLASCYGISLTKEI